MDLSKLDRSEIIGMVAAAVLVISLFLEWFSLSTDPSVVQRGSDPGNWACGVGNSSCSAWDTFPIARWLLLAAAAAPFILAWIVVRGHALSWPRGEVTAIVGADRLRADRLQRDRRQAPGRPRDQPRRSATGSPCSPPIGIFISGGFRAVESGGGAQRKPPATF